MYHVTRHECDITRDGAARARSRRVRTACCGASYPPHPPAAARAHRVKRAGFRGACSGVCRAVTAAVRASRAHCPHAVARLSGHPCQRVAPHWRAVRASPSCHARGHRPGARRPLGAAGQARPGAPAHATARPARHNTERPARILNLILILTLILIMILSLDYIIFRGNTHAGKGRRRNGKGEHDVRNADAYMQQNIIGNRACQAGVD